ncbi:hypothetical protein RUND412_004985 [Rhizina undulata]
MVRPLLPKEEGGTSPSLESLLPSPIRVAKRRCVSSACIPCRKRKSKCDGIAPACSTCTAVYQTPCQYDIDGDHRRKGALKRDIEQLKEKNDSLGNIIANIRSAPESQLEDIIRHIRSNGSMGEIAKTIKENGPLPDPVTIPMERDLSTIMAKLRKGDDDVEMGSGSASPPVLNDGVRRTKKDWTRVTSDRRFVSDIMSNYFTWSHPVYPLFSKACLLSDMYRNRCKYCSSLLINAILSIGCHYSNRREAYEDPKDPTTAGGHFFKEAKILLDELEKPCITAVQALALLSVREAGRGRDSQGWMYSGRAFRMALDLGMHLTPPPGKVSVTELEVRKITFWGLFALDKVWSMHFGRVPELSPSIIDLGVPNPIGEFEAEVWRPYPPNLDDPTEPSKIYSIAAKFVDISVVLGEILQAFYLPKERMTSKRLVDIYMRLKQVQRQLLGYSPSEKSQASILVLHMFYHATVLMLFRPFMNTPVPSLGDTTRNLCLAAATEIISLVSVYRNIYTLRRISMLVPNLILSACTIFILGLPDKLQQAKLDQGILDLREIGNCWPVCHQNLQIIQDLSKKWNVSLPEGTKQAMCMVVTVQPSRTSRSPPGFKPSAAMPWSDPSIQQAFDEYTKEENSQSPGQSMSAIDYLGCQTQEWNPLNPDEFIRDCIMEFPAGSSGSSGSGEWSV